MEPSSGKGTERLYWTSWVVAVLLTGVVAGFMLGHALILAPFLDWMLGRPGLLAETYPVFRSSAGRSGLTLFYAVAGLQVLAALEFLGVALVTGRQRLPAVMAGVAGAGWLLVHYASGFGAVEATVAGSGGPLPGEIVQRFVAWNTPIHFVHAAVLTVALGALLAVPLSALRRRGQQGEADA